MPEKALLNDVNVHLMNFFRWIQKGLVIEMPMNNDEFLYYEYRARFNWLFRAGKENSQEKLPDYFII